MLKELLSVFRSSDPLRAMGNNFAKMLGLAREMTLSAGEIYFGGAASGEARKVLYARDANVNELQRQIRRQVVMHLSLDESRADLPHALLLISLVKDVERLGDYAKNLAEVHDMRPGPLPDDSLRRELEEIRTDVEDACHALSAVFETADRDKAVPLIEKRREAARQCDALIARVAASEHDAATATALALGARYYKRIGGHVLNILSSVVMPLDKVDYYDEDEVPEVNR